ncbi:MAG TPA: IPT/TIG domain-containing protein [Acidimicrobiales bacterium]|nr:IPT/TIG domain-containing protein [Acidimicrobiales bacterium]
MKLLTESQRYFARPGHAIPRIASAIAVVVGATVGSFALIGSTTASAAGGPDAVSGSAFGASVVLAGTTIVPPTPTVTLPSSGAAQTASILTIPSNPLITTGVATLNTAATNATLATEVVNTSSDLANPALLNTIPGLPIGIVSVLSADAIHTVCQSSATGSTGGTTVVNLVVGGTPIPVSTAVDQIPTLPAPLSTLLSIEINKQVVVNTPGATGITVDGLVITLLTPLAGGAVITLSESVCGATGPDINAAPAVTGINPNSGPTAGGTVVTITGTGFQCVTGVKFGSTPASSFTVVSPTDISATSPPGAAGVVDVTVTNCNGTSPTGTADQFTYVASSSGTTVVPAATPSPLSGATAVTG